MNKTFTKEDYNSQDGMLTSVWGPSLWHSLHAISFNYPVNPTQKQKNEYLSFFKSLKNILPILVKIKLPIRVINVSSSLPEFFW